MFELNLKLVTILWIGSDFYFGSATRVLKDVFSFTVVNISNMNALPLISQLIEPGSDQTGFLVSWYLKKIYVHQNQTIVLPTSLTEIIIFLIINV